MRHFECKHFTASILRRFSKYPELFTFPAILKWRLVKCTWQKLLMQFFKTVAENLVAMQVIVILKILRPTTVISKRVPRLRVPIVNQNQSTLPLDLLLLGILVIVVIVKLHKLNGKFTKTLIHMKVYGFRITMKGKVF